MTKTIYGEDATVLRVLNEIELCARLAAINGTGTPALELTAFANHLKLRMKHITTEHPTHAD